MFDRPQLYAHFLEQEISFQTKEPLLVVMPKGYGVEGLSPEIAAGAASLARPAGGESDDLARAAIAAVRALAAASGHRIETTANSVTAGNVHHSVSLELVVLAFAAAAAAGLIGFRGRGPGRSLSSDCVRSPCAYAAAAPLSSDARCMFIHGLQAGAIKLSRCSWLGWC